MIALLLATLLAQADPTPFWMPPPPPKKETPPKKKKKPVQVKPLEIPAKPPPPPPVEQPTWIEGTPSGDTSVGHLPQGVPSPEVSREGVPKMPQPEAARIPKPIVPPPAPVPPAEPAPIVLAEPEPEPAPASELRRWTVDATFGAWGSSRSDGSGRSWDPAYGLRGGYALFESVELELQLARAGGTAGSPFVSASAARNLAAARVFWVLGDRLALLLGGGGGVTLSQTHYTLLPSTDPGAVAAGLDANAIKSVIEITAAGRARVFRGLEARAEVSALLRDGRLELLPLVGVGAAF